MWEHSKQRVVVNDPKDGVSSVGFPTGVMESLWSAEGLIRERWCCARGWLMLAVITGDKWNFVLLLFLCTPHYGHTLVTDNHINTHIQLNELVGSTKISSRGFPNTSPEKQTF